MSDKINEEADPHPDELADCPFDAATLELIVKVITKCCSDECTDRALVHRGLKQ